MARQLIPSLTAIRQIKNTHSTFGPKPSIEQILYVNSQFIKLAQVDSTSKEHAWNTTNWTGRPEKMRGSGYLPAREYSFFLDFCSTLHQGKVENENKHHHLNRYTHLAFHTLAFWKLNWWYLGVQQRVRLWRISLRPFCSPPATISLTLARQSFQWFRSIRWLTNLVRKRIGNLAGRISERAKIAQPESYSIMNFVPLALVHAELSLYCYQCLPQITQISADITTSSAWLESKSARICEISGKHNYSYLVPSALVLFFILFLSSCTNDFDQINENPNTPEKVHPQFLLTNVIFEAADQSAYNQGFRLANFLAQFAASPEFERIDRYEMGGNSAYWNTIFRLLSDIRSMQELEGTNEAYQAVGDIMSSYLFSQLTDLWGDVPYTEAVQAIDGNYAPKYDTQKNIYTDPQTGILAVLKRAAHTLKNTSSPIAGDILFDNNLDGWIRFANSLRLRYLMRISHRLSDYSEIQELAESDKLISSNSQNAVVPYLSSAPNQWPMSASALGLYQEHRMSKTVDSVLTLWNDPRIAVLYQPTEKSTTSGHPEYKGLQNGQTSETISEKGINLSDISLFGSIFRDIPNGVNAQFMQYSEVQFALAEAAERDFIEADAGKYYKEGIRASFEYYGLEVPNDYFNQTSVALNGENNLIKIMTQKWLSLIGIGHEAWFNVRRTGIPELKPGPDNLNEDRYPVRYLYPESEQATNAENYKGAVSRMGGDNINNKGWWERFQ